MATVDNPMVNNDATSIDFRPTRSPKCPNSNDPSGRARKATAKVENAASVPTTGERSGKKVALSTSAAAVP